MPSVCTLSACRCGVRRRLLCSDCDFRAGGAYGVGVQGWWVRRRHRTVAPQALVEGIQPTLSHGLDRFGDAALGRTCRPQGHEFLLVVPRPLSRRHEVPRLTRVGFTRAWVDADCDATRVAAEWLTDLTRRARRRLSASDVRADTAEVGGGCLA